MVRHNYLDLLFVFTANVILIAPMPYIQSGLSATSGSFSGTWVANGSSESRRKSFFL